MLVAYLTEDYILVEQTALPTFDPTTNPAEIDSYVQENNSLLKQMLDAAARALTIGFATKFAQSFVDAFVRGFWGKDESHPGLQIGQKVRDMVDSTLDFLGIKKARDKVLNFIEKVGKTIGDYFKSPWKKLGVVLVAFGTVVASLSAARARLNVKDLTGGRIIRFIKTVKAYFKHLLKDKYGRIGLFFLVVGISLIVFG